MYWLTRRWNAARLRSAGDPGETSVGRRDGCHGNLHLAATGQFSFCMIFATELASQHHRLHGPVRLTLRASAAQGAVTPENPRDISGNETAENAETIRAFAHASDASLVRRQFLEPCCATFAEGVCGWRGPHRDCVDDGGPERNSGAGIEVIHCLEALSLGLPWLRSEHRGRHACAGHL